MSSKWWFLIGAVLEGAGFSLVGAEIRHRRRLLTGKTSIFWQATAPLRWVLRKLRRKHPINATVTAATAELKWGVNAPTVLTEPSWEQLDSGGKLDRLLLCIQAHDEKLEEHHKRISEEAKAREEGDRSLAGTLEGAKAEFGERLAEAVAGDLDLETLGITLFVCGLIASTIGALG